MHTRLVTFVTRLFVAIGILLALPSTAMGAPFSFTGPTAVSESAGTATYTVDCGTTSVPILGEVPNIGTLAVTVSDGPAPAAVSGEDYGPTSGIPTAFTCPPAGASTVEVPILNDAVDESSENFSVRISGGLLAGVTPVPVDQTVMTTITDDDPIATITPVAFVLEGNSGTSTANLTVTLASAAAQVTTIAYETDQLTATPGSDYTAVSGDIVFQVGQTSKTIGVPIIGDTVPEANEGLFVNLTSTDNGSLGVTAKQGGIAIVNDDKSPLPTVSIEKSASTVEGDSGTSNVLLNVTLSAAATARTEVKWKTGNWTADKTDYDRANGKVIFRKGQKSKTVSVDVKGDRRDEPDEAFTVTLESPAGALLGTKKAGFGVIEDDDGPKMKLGKAKVRGERLVTKVGCPASADGCKGRLVAKSKELKLGRKKFDLDKGETKKLKLKLSRRALAALEERARRAKLIARASDSTGDTRVTKRKVRLRES